jgi:hypothetical protein
VKTNLLDDGIVNTSVAISATNAFDLPFSRITRTARHDRSDVGQIDRDIDVAACGRRKTARKPSAPPTSVQLAQRSKRRSDLGHEDFRLFPRREVTAPLGFVPTNKLVITTFGPASWRAVDLTGKDRDSGSDGDAGGVEGLGVILPV